MDTGAIVFFLVFAGAILALAIVLPRLFLLGQERSDVIPNGEVGASTGPAAHVSSAIGGLRRDSDHDADKSLYRLMIVTVCWLLSGWAVFGSFVFFVNLFMTKTGYGDISLQGVLGIAWILVQVYAWLALLVMSVGWIQDRKVHRAWAITGTIAGVASILPAAKVFVFALPGILLALVLVRFHLEKKIENALVVPPRP